MPCVISRGRGSKLICSLKGPFNISTGLMSFPFRFSLTNVGHYPAFNVRMSAFLYTPQAANQDVFAVWKKRCADWKTETDVNKTAGFVIFPGKILRVTNSPS